MKNSLRKKDFIVIQMNTDSIFPINFYQLNTNYVFASSRLSFTGSYVDKLRITLSHKLIAD